VTNGVAFGLGVGLGFALSLARLVAMPTFKTALLVLLGDGVGMAVATPVILALAYVLLRKKEPNSPSSE
jgi:hypothetical protein